MAKSLIGPAAQQKITTTGISANTIAAGTTAKILQGSKEVLNVQGTFTSDATAYAGNILNGAVADTKGQRIVGNIPVRTNIYEAPLMGQDPNRGAYGILGNNVWVVPAVGYYPNFDMNKSRMDIHGPTLANTVGLTPNKLLAGTTVLGVTGRLEVLATGNSGPAQSTYNIAYWYKQTGRYELINGTVDITISGTPLFLHIVRLDGTSEINICGKNSVGVYTEADGLTRKIKYPWLSTNSVYCAFVVLGIKD